MTKIDTSSLQGKAALITGGSQGIGAGIALQFAKKGIAAIAVTYATNLKSAEEVLARCRSIAPSLKTVAIEADLLDPSIGPKLISKTLQGLGIQQIDIVVNNAAIVNDLSLLEPFADITLEAFNKTMQANVFAPISIVQAALPHFPPRGGRVINISSIASKAANGDPILTYGASKAGLDSITRSLAFLLGEKAGATFNSVNVGPTRSGVTAKLEDSWGKERFDQMLAPVTAGRRMGEPEDIAFVVGFLASEEGRWINGHSVAANGGFKETLALQG